MKPSFSWCPCPIPPRTLTDHFRTLICERNLEGRWLDPRWKSLWKWVPAAVNWHTLLWVQDLWGRECGGPGRRINVCQNYIQKKSRLFQNFTMLKRAVRVWVQGAGPGGNSVLSACPSGGCVSLSICAGSSVFIYYVFLSVWSLDYLHQKHLGCQLKMQIPRAHPRPKDSDPLGRGQGLCNLNKHTWKFYIH